MAATIAGEGGLVIPAKEVMCAAERRGLLVIGGAVAGCGLVIEVRVELDEVVEILGNGLMIDGFCGEEVELAE